MRPGEDLKSLERLLLDRRTPYSTCLCEAETFLRAHPEPKDVEGLSLALISALITTASKGRDEEIVQEAGAQYNARTWQIAFAYCTEGIARVAHLPIAEQILGSLHINAGNCALNFAKNTNNRGLKETYLKSAVEHYTKSIDLNEKTEPRIVAYILSYRADARKELAELNFGTNKILLLEKAAEDLDEGARRTEDTDSEQASRQYSFASNCEYRLALLANRTRGRQIQFFEKAIQHARKAIAFANNPDPHYKARLDYDIGKYADGLFKVTQSQEAAALAITHYKKAAEHFMRHPGPKADLQNSALARIEELTRIIA